MIELLFLYIICLISLSSIIISYKRVSNHDTKIGFVQLLLFFVGTIISLALLYFNQSFLKNVFTIVFLAVLFKKMSNIHIFESLYYSIMIWLYLLILDLAVMLVVSVSGLINMFDLFLIQIVCTIIMAIILYLFCSLPIIKKFTNNTVKKLMKIKPNIILDILFILILIYLSMLCFYNLQSMSNLIVYIVFSLIIVLVFYIILDKHFSIKKLKEVNSRLIKNNEFFIELEDKHRILKHNLVNQLLGIKSVSNKKTKDLIDELIISYNKNYIPPKDIINAPEGINGMVYEKFYSFNNKDIKLIIDNNIKSVLIENMHPKTFNTLCEILGVLIDNALEATSKSKEKNILLNFSEDKNFYYLNINNTFNNLLDIDSYGEKNYSTKKGNRGIGIFSVLKRREVLVKSKVINNYFITDIKIKKYNF